MSSHALETYDREGLTCLMWAARHRLGRTVTALCARAEQAPAALVAAGDAFLLDLNARERLRMSREVCRAREGDVPFWGRTAAEMLEAGIVNGNPLPSAESETRQALQNAARHHLLVRGPAVCELLFLAADEHGRTLFPPELAAIVCAYADVCTVYVAAPSSKTPKKTKAPEQKRNRKRERPRANGTTPETAPAKRGPRVQPARQAKRAT
jgi:hypothetical protein